MLFLFLHLVGEEDINTVEEEMAPGAVSDVVDVQMQAFLKVNALMDTYYDEGILPWPEPNIESEMIQVIEGEETSGLQSPVVIE